MPKRKKNAEKKRTRSRSKRQQEDRKSINLVSDKFVFKPQGKVEIENNDENLNLPPTCTTTNPSCAPEQGQSCSISGDSCFLYHRQLMCCENCPADC